LKDSYVGFLLPKPSIPLDTGNLLVSGCSNMLLL